MSVMDKWKVLSHCPLYSLWTDSDVHNMLETLSIVSAPWIHKLKSSLFLVFSPFLFGVVGTNECIISQATTEASCKWGSSFLTHSFSKLHWMLFFLLLIWVDAEASGPHREPGPCVLTSWNSFFIDGSHAIISERTDLTQFLKWICQNSHPSLPLLWVF